jgi:DNA-binding MarR family transcriptional regulator
VQHPRNAGGFDPDAAARLRRVISRLARAMNRSSSTEELTPTQASVLGVIVARGPVRSAVLAELEGLNPTMLSRVMGALEQKGLIVRTPASADQRGVLGQATDAGREKSARILEQRAAALVDTVSALPPETAAAVLAALPALEELTDALSERQPPTGAPTA